MTHVSEASESLSERAIDLRPDLDPDDYSAVVTFACEISAKIGLIVRSRSVELSAAGKAVLSDLVAVEQGVKDVFSWPGTQRVGSVAAVRHLYRADAQAADVIGRRASNFNEWVNPALPEDVHFVRNDGSLVLASVAQHDRAWLELTADEVAHLELGFPGLLGRIEASFRRLTQVERRILDRFAEEWAAGGGPSAEALRAQVPHVRVEQGYSVTSIPLKLDEDAPLLDLSDGVLPLNAEVLDDDGGEIGRLQLWVSNGRLEGMEYSWWTQEQPSHLPDASKLQFTHV